MPGNHDECVKLVGDIGGTNARFAVLIDQSLTPRHEEVLPCAAYACVTDAIRDYLSRVDAPQPRRGAIAIANPVTGDWVQMTNFAWAFSIEDTRKSLGFDELIVLNDFTALAMALPLLPREELRKIGGGQPISGAPLALIGPGTGLGVSGLLPSASGWIAIQGEGGHTSFSPADAREADILRFVWREFGHVSTERLVSGIGLGNLYRAVAELNGHTREALAPAEITRGALEGKDPLCIETVDTFCAMLGTAAANLTLTLGARGGVYIGGGIVPRLGSYFDRSPFRSRFESMGRFADFLAAIPSYVITASTPALLGAAQALRGPGTA